MKKNWFVGFIICLVLCICFFIGICILVGILVATSPIRSDVKDVSFQELATVEAYSIIEAAKLNYTEGLFMGIPVTSGNVADLKLSSGKKFDSGTWNINQQTGQIELKNVIINDCVCNTDNDYKVICIHE